MLQILDTGDFDKLYALLEISFPPDERRDYEGQKQLFDNPQYTAYVVYNDSGDGIKALITVHRLEKIAFIEHFAVNPSFRNQGLGAAILTELKKMLKTKICLEAEPPSDSITERRIGFYKRNGFYLNNYPYVQPAFSNEKQPVPLLIMTTEAPVDKEEFEYIKSVLYKEVYHVI